MSNETNGAPPRPRGKPSEEGRFFWVASLAHERIINRLGLTQAAYGTAVYTALCRMSAKQRNDPVIVASISEIAGATRLGYRKTMEILHALASDKIKVISIQERRTPGRKTQDESVYTLLATRLPNRKSDRSTQNNDPDSVKPGKADFPIGSQADFPGRSPSYAEIPIDSLQSRESIENNASALAASSPARSAEPLPSEVKKLRTPFTEVGDWGKP